MVSTKPAQSEPAEISVAKQSGSHLPPMLDPFVWVRPIGHSKCLREQPGGASPPTSVPSDSGGPGQCGEGSDLAELFRGSQKITRDSTETSAKSPCAHARYDGKRKNQPANTRS